MMMMMTASGEGRWSNNNDDSTAPAPFHLGDVTTEATPTHVVLPLQHVAVLPLLAGRAFIPVFHGVNVDFVAGRNAGQGYDAV